MADEQPKRFKGAKHLEAGYRAGYSDGYAQGAKDAKAELELAETSRKSFEATLYYGLDRLKREQQAKPKPKRTRRTKNAEEKRLDEVAARRDAAFDATQDVS